MKEFNLLENVLENSYTCGKKNRFRILALNGNPNEWAVDTKRKWDVDKEKYISIYFKSMSERKLESNRKTKCSVLVFDNKGGIPGGVGSLEWKCIYRNIQGFYFNKKNKKQYINDLLNI